jgi:hypothetical protein
MFELKPIAKASIPRALEKAERYRLLNEPEEAESICLDVIAVDPSNQAAHVMLLLARTDLFGTAPNAHLQARDVLKSLQSEYERAYYSGIIAERLAKAQVARGGMVVGVHDWLVDAMQHYEAADRIRPSGNDDARLRYNACVRFLERHPHLRSGREEERTEIEMLE